MTKKTHQRADSLQAFCWRAKRSPRVIRPWKSRNSKDLERSMSQGRMGWEALFSILFLVNRIFPILCPEFTERTHRKAGLYLSYRTVRTSPLAGASSRPPGYDGVDHPGKGATHHAAYPHRLHPPSPSLGFLYINLQSQYPDHRHSALYTENPPNAIHCDPAGADPHLERPGPFGGTRRQGAGAPTSLRV